MAMRLAGHFWPGPLTMLMPAAAALAPDLSGGTGKVGVRVPADPIARAVCAACGHPVTATSANVSGEPAPATADEVERMLGDRIDFLLDAGPTRGGAPSTIVDVTEGEPRLVRAGAISWDEIQAWLDIARA
jgi:L-threonylcarbamoyladenylate synthase